MAEITPNAGELGTHLWFGRTRPQDGGARLKFGRVQPCQVRPTSANFGPKVAQMVLVTGGIHFGTDLLGSKDIPGLCMELWVDLEKCLLGRFARVTCGARLSLTFHRRLALRNARLRAEIVWCRGDGGAHVEGRPATRCVVNACGGPQWSGASRRGVWQDLGKISLRVRPMRPETTPGNHFEGTVRQFRSSRPTACAERVNLAGIMCSGHARRACFLVWGRFGIVQG